VSVADAALPFVASSPAAFAASELRDHPAWVDAAGVLDTATFEALHAEVVRLFADANEDKGAFRVTSDYVVATMQRGSA
jgi:hypothetical protein